MNLVADDARLMKRAYRAVSACETTAMTPSSCIDSITLSVRERNCSNTEDYVYEKAWQAAFPTVVGLRNLNETLKTNGTLAHDLTELRDKRIMLACAFIRCHVHVISSD